MLLQLNNNLFPHRRLMLMLLFSLLHHQDAKQQHQQHSKPCLRSHCALFCHRTLAKTRKHSKHKRKRRETHASVIRCLLLELGLCSRSLNTHQHHQQQQRALYHTLRCLILSTHSPQRRTGVHVLSILSVLLFIQQRSTSSSLWQQYAGHPAIEERADCHCQLMDPCGCCVGTWREAESRRGLLRCP